MLYGVDCDDPNCGFCYGRKAEPPRERPMRDLFDAPPPPDPWPIEEGIPVGKDESQRQRVKWARPDFQKQLGRLQVGQSFTVGPERCGGAPLIVVQNMASGAAATYCKDFPPGTRKFTTRQIGGRFVRVWRTV